MAFRWDDYIDQAEDFERILWYEDPDGVYIQLTGYTFEAAIRSTNEPEASPLASFTCEVVENPEPSSVPGNEDLTDRALRLRLADDLSDDLEAGEYFFELWSQDPTGLRECDFAGTWRVYARATRIV